MKRNVIPGIRYGELTVIKEVEPSRSPQGRCCRMVECLCNCGTVKVFYLDNLISGRSRSCDSGSEQHRGKHQLSQSVEWKIWRDLRNRCENPNNPAFKNYGARGILVCERWRIFLNFYNDMGSRPSSKHTIERRDNDGDYEPSNCKWLLKRLQSRNRRGLALNMETARKIRSLHQSGMGPKAISEILNKSKGTIEHVLYSEGWSDQA